ncbi:MAG: cell division protein FtsQ/DivIB [Lachnospiraceae bacterium]|nr:cell division protein FtsQ/DivIB [Lachnospiraceae bacterium]
MTAAVKTLPKRGGKITYIKPKAQGMQKGMKAALVVSILLLFLAALLSFVLLHFRVETVRVDGNLRYTDEEIREMVVKDYLSENTLFLRMKYGNRPIENVPYLERIDVTFPDSHTVRLVVYEKALAGYIEYLGQYMYFDRQGIVVASGTELIPGVPQVLGLNYDYFVMHEPLPIANEQVFQQVLNITQLLEKYRLSADKIFFDKNYNIYLYFGGVEAELGEAVHIDEKLAQLVNILPELEGERGILRMKDYTPTSLGITYEGR